MMNASKDIKTNKQIPRDIFAAYLGQNPDPYLRYYDKVKDKQSRYNLSLNWAALLVLPFWLGYRKQWILLSLVVAFLILTDILGLFLSQGVPPGVPLFIWIWGAMSANMFVLDSANRKYAAWEKAGKNDTEIHSLISGHCTTSWPKAIGGAALFVFGTLVVDVATTPEPGVRLSYELDDYAIESIKSLNLVGDDEDIVAYYDASHRMDGSEAVILTRKRILQHKNSHTTFIYLSQIEEIEHSSPRFLGDHIAIRSKTGDTIRFIIMPLHGGDKFLWAIYEMLDAVTDPFLRSKEE